MPEATLRPLSLAASLCFTTARARLRLHATRLERPCLAAVQASRRGRARCVHRVERVDILVQPLSVSGDHSDAPAVDGDQQELSTVRVLRTLPLSVRACALFQMALAKK